MSHIWLYIPDCETWNEMSVIEQGDLQISEELSSHDTLQQHVQVRTVLEAGYQVHHEAAVALCLNLLLAFHMRL